MSQVQDSLQNSPAGVGSQRPFYYDIEVEDDRVAQVASMLRERGFKETEEMVREAMRASVYLITIYGRITLDSTPY